MSSEGCSKGDDDDDTHKLPVKKIKNASDLQRLKLEKLLKKHAENKEVFIPDRPKERKLREPLEFIRNIWGSSAGVGSGDFDVYRGIRRREYARQKYILGKSEKEDLDEAYKQKVIQNKLDAESRTAKKREKRLRKKKNKNVKKQKLKSDDAVADEDSSHDSSNEEDSGKGEEDTANRSDTVKKSELTDT